MKLYYRAIEGTNTKTRRLAYLTAILKELRQSSLSEQVLLNRIVTWSLDHQADIYNYYVHTGEITSTRKNSAGTHYLEVTTRAKLIVPLAGMYRITRIGSVLIALIMRTYQPNPNPFFLTVPEKLFYSYCLLKTDADLLLTVVDSLFERRDISLAILQETFKENFLRRLNNKLLSVQDEALRQQLRDRKLKVEDEWKKPERYAEHIVPPRLNWLLDLGFLKAVPFRHHGFEFTDEAQQFISALPHFGEFCLHDVTDQWLDLEYWKVAASTLAGFEFSKNWKEVDEEKQYSLMRTLLAEAFSVFRYAVVPKISLLQIMLYLSIRLLLEHQISAGPSVLTEWFSSAPVIDGQRYEVRLSPRENESYLIIL